ncbi:MAG: heavy metal-binding domain-containing protein, partial [Bdellovibrionales bacterium]|nr:heavy metal-binding domain-containing protein [Bdellovibrionales bacterium]
MEDFIPFIWGLVTLFLAFMIGTTVERRHYRSIRSREEALMHIPVVAGKAQSMVARATRGQLAIGNVVISHDYFKRFLASIRCMFGGRVGSYESLIDRARREAILRMREAHPTAEAFVNVRIETSSIGKNATAKGGIGSIEAIAYGTALYFGTLTGG